MKKNLTYLAILFLAAGIRSVLPDGWFFDAVLSLVTVFMLLRIMYSVGNWIYQKTSDYYDNRSPFI